MGAKVVKLIGTKNIVNKLVVGVGHFCVKKPIPTTNYRRNMDGILVYEHLFAVLDDDAAGLVGGPDAIQTIGMAIGYGIGLFYLGDT